MSRDLVADETAERNRTVGEGGYTFNAPLAKDFEGTAFTFGAIRVGDHAHVDVGSGRAVKGRVGRGQAGRLVLRWHEWETLRAILAASDAVLIAEVERPTLGQLDYHTR